MLSPNKLKYIKGIQKYVSFSVVTTIAIAIVVLTIFIVNQTVIKGKTLSNIPNSPFFSVIIIALLLYCFVFYRIKKRFKRLQELIEQMTEEDFQFLLQAQSSLSFWHYMGRGSNLVEILSPETTKFEVYTSAYPYLEKLIRKYNPNADIEV